MGFDLKDSGARQEFETGARRDLQEGKGRPDLISTIFKQRLSVVMEKGANKYGDRNWEKGMPLSRFASSAMRHLDQYVEGWRDEDHLGQAAFNIMALMHTETLVLDGELPDELLDIPRRGISLQDTSFDEVTAAAVKIAEEYLRAHFPVKHDPNGIDWDSKIKQSEEAFERAGMVEGLDGVWRGATTIHESVKSPGERQVPIFAQPTQDHVRGEDVTSTGELA